MMKYRQITAIIVTLLVCALFTMGCKVVLVPADEKIEPGELETRQFDFVEFTDVDISGAFSYEIQKADDWSISITAGSNLFEYITVTVSGQELDIDINIPGGTFWTNRSSSRPKALITMPILTGLDSSGATDGTVTGFRSDDDLDISLSGASEIELSDMSTGMTFMDLSGASRISGHIQVDTIELDVSSASRVHLEGSADYLMVEAGGASKVELGDFITQNADITLRDASRGGFNLVETLDAQVNGASSLEYTGEPVIGDLEVTGASTFRKK
ncbi:MAG: DUF2807 domain-containing protein [Dehalococcoidales bacterium]|nr:MAG: DUF2807 domain-containing protein [Dehalococcoidales bacterium]